jgi:hypothetical protein
MIAVCCDNKRNVQVRTVVKMQSFNVKASGTHVYHFALSIYTKKSYYLQIALKLERQNEQVR